MFRIKLLTLVLLFGFVGPFCKAQDNSPQAPHRELRDLNSYFPFTPPKSVEKWAERKEQVRRHLKVALGLWPMPPKTPLNATIHGQMDMGQYTIEKVYFESMPGFFSTGNLYRPKNDRSVVNGKRPAVLCPHGHHRDGRFRQASEADIDAQIAKGAEKFRNNARSILQARCAHLAKMGCIVFHYDMIGYADSQQISYGIAHGFAKQRPEMIDNASWGFFSPQAESNLQSIMGLQTWNSIRALDLLEALPEVDMNRIGVTGASGGGTQTFILGAIDDRPAVCAPAVMVSTAMQGGCTCENCSYLRVGTGNVEFAAMFAPKPMHLTAANDWTKEMETKGFPELKQLYKLLGAPDNVQLTSRTEFEHNYNQVCREATYQFFAKHLNLDGPTQESEIEFVHPSKLTVYDNNHPRPPGGEEIERALLRTWTNQSRQTLATLVPGTPTQLEKFRTVVGGAWGAMLKSALDYDGGFWDSVEDKVEDDVVTLKCSNKFGEYLTVRMDLNAKGPNGIIFATESGTKLFDDEASSPFAKIIAGKQHTTYGYDLNFLSDADRKQTRRVKNNREAAAYTLGYNPAQILRRAVAPASLLIEDEEVEGEEIDPLFDDLFQDDLELEKEVDDDSGPNAAIVSIDKTSIDAAVAIPLLIDNVEIYVLNTDGFRFQDVKDIRDPNFLPGGAKYFDVPGLLALAAPHPMLLFGEDENSAAVTVAAYRAAGAIDKLTFGAKKDMNEEFIQTWLNKYFKSD